ncbi:MAG: hypothetical protein MK212_12130 [Saprospiraceae bacterium]|nr:hypothetical protein [Saprospiraceae bacterium]
MIYLVCKSILLGFIWGGSFLLIASYAIHIFPLPAFYGLRDWILRWIDRRFKYKLEARQRWSTRLGVFSILLVIGLWLSLIGLYAYGLYGLMDSYVPDAAQANFGLNYGVAVAPTSLWMLWKMIKTLWSKGEEKQKSKLLKAALEDDDRSLIQQIIQ